MEIYINDPLIYHGKMTAKLLSENLTKGIIARVGLNIINLPALLLHGTEDHLVPLSSSDDIFNNISSEDKEYEVCITVLISKKKHKNEEYTIIQTVYSYMEEIITLEQNDT